MDRLDPARTALVMVHMAKGVVGTSTPPSTGCSGTGPEEPGIIGVQARLLDGFRTAKAKVVYTLVTYQPGFPGITSNSPLFRTAIDANCVLEGTPAVEVMDELAPRPDEPLVRGRRDTHCRRGPQRPGIATARRAANSKAIVLVVASNTRRTLKASPHVYPDSQARGQNGDNRQQNRVCRVKAWCVGCAHA